MDSSDDDAVAAAASSSDESMSTQNAVKVRKVSGRLVKMLDAGDSRPQLAHHRDTALPTKEIG